MTKLEEIIELDDADDRAIAHDIDESFYEWLWILEQEAKPMTKKKPCPGSKIRSKGKGRGLGRGKRKGPIGRPQKR